MNRREKALFTSLTMGADSSWSGEISVGRDGFVALQVLIDDGAGNAPTDTPVGVFEVQCSGGRRWSTVVSTLLSTELAKVAANGNVKIDGWAIIVGIPGSACRVRYKRTSGGGGNSRLSVDVSTW